MKSTLVKLSLALTTALMLAPSAHASLLLEPYLGYHFGGSDDNNGTTHNISGVTYGGRLGIEHLGLMAGADYQTGSWSDNATPSNTIVPSDLGAFVGFNFPIMLRVYGEYMFAAQRKVTNSSGFNDTYKGTEIKLGVGFTMLPLVAINVEYMASTLTKDNGGTLAHNLTDHMIGLNVSLPLTFM